MNTKYFNEIFKVLPTPTLIVRPENTKFIIVAVNDAYLSIGDLNREDLIGNNFFDAFPKNPYLEIPEWRESFARVMKAKQPDRVPTKQFVGFLQNEIKVRFFDVVNVPVLNENGEVEYIMRSVADVTAIVEAEERRRAALDRLVSREKFLNETQRVGISGGWELDLMLNRVTWSDIQKEIHEVAIDYEPKMMDLINFYSEESHRETMTRLINEAIHYGRIFDVELTIKTAKGAERLVRTTGKSEIREGKCIRIYGVTQDITERRQTELSLDVSQDRFESILRSIDGIVWEASATALQLTFISEQAEKILGYTSAEMLSVPDFGLNLVHEEDREAAYAYFKAKTKMGEAFDLEFRIQRADGHYVWVKNYVMPIKSQQENEGIIRGLMIDISVNKRMGEIEYLERNILEQNAKHNLPIKEVLNAYVAGIQAVYPKMQCSILRVKHNRLYTWAAPSLPESYVHAMEGKDIGKSIGSCGAAAFLKQPVIVEDIEHDFRWASFRAIAMKSELRACWSYPIINSQGEVIATFGIYYKEPKAPDEEEVEVISRGTSLLSIILENRIYAEALEDNTDLMNQSQKLAQFGNWVWDVKHDEVTWSDSLYEMYGMDKDEFKPTFESYLKILHKEDQERVSASIGKVLSTKEKSQFEERIIRPDGEVRLLKSWSLPKLDQAGQVLKLIGASIDVTEKRKAEERLRASESRLRSLVETQSNYVIRLDFVGNYTYCNGKYEEDFGWIYPGKNIIGQKAMDSVFEYDYQYLFDIGEKCINHPNQVFKAEIDKHAPNGGTRHTLWHFVCLTDAKGLPHEMQCIGIDITEWKIAEQALRRSNERFSYVNKATNDAIYEWDIVRDHIEWGDGYQRLFGYELGSESFALHEWSARVHPEDHDFLEQHLNEVLASEEEHWKVEYRYRKADLTYAEVEEVGYIIRDGAGKALRMIGVMRDITARKAAELERKALNFRLEQSLAEMALSNLELVESRQRYRDLFHFSPQPMYVYDVQTLMFVDVNDAAIEFYGYSREEFLKMDITRIRPKSEVPKLLDAIAGQAMKGLINHGIFKHVKKNGEEVHVDVQSNSINFNEKPSSLVVVKDMSERLRYLQAVESQNKILKEISWMQSHVVRAPLSRLMSLVDLFARAHGDGDEEKELLDFIMGSAHELDEIIRDISQKTEMASLILKT